MKKLPYWKVYIQRIEDLIHRIQRSDSEKLEAINYIEMLEKSETAWMDSPEEAQDIAELVRKIPVSDYTIELIERLNSIESNLLAR